MFNRNNQEGLTVKNNKKFKNTLKNEVETKTFQTNKGLRNLSTLDLPYKKDSKKFFKL